MRDAVLRGLYRLFPFDLMGDCDVPPSRDGIKISCMVSFYGRLDLLSGVLFCLAEQDFPRELFEVILVEDKGGTDEGRACWAISRIFIRYGDMSSHIFQLLTKEPKKTASSGSVE